MEEPSRGQLIEGLRMCYASYGIESIAYLLPQDILDAEAESRRKYPKFKPKIRHLEDELAEARRQIENFLTYGQGGANFSESQLIDQIREQEERAEKAEAALKAVNLPHAGCHNDT